MIVSLEAVPFKSTTARPTHPWLRQTSVAAVPGSTTSLLEEVVSNLLHHFRLQGHQVRATPMIAPT
jgi:hypothetical protein